MQKLSALLKSIIVFARAHVLITTLVMLVIAGGGYYSYRTLFASASTARYVTGSVTRGTIIASVSASGQIAASDQVDIKPKVAGDITRVLVQEGAKVRAGQALAYLDSTNARQAVSDAEDALTQAELQYKRDSAEAPISFEKAQQAVTEASDDLVSAYTDTYSAISNTYLALPTVVTDTQNALLATTMSPNRTQANIDFLTDTIATVGNLTVKNLATKARADYEAARTDYDESLLKYKQLTRASSNADVEAMLTRSIEVTSSMAQALQSELNFFDAVIDIAGQYSITLPGTVATNRATAKADLSTVNTNLSALLSQKKALDAAKKAVVDSKNDLTLLQVGNPTGATPISLQAQAADIASKKRKLQEAKSALSDYVITAPFGGTLATFTAKRGDTVSSASVGSLVTTETVAELSLNEVDAAKVKVGDKATMTFDALPDLTLTGKVVSTDAVGTVTQGVVSYTITLSLDVQDSRVKPGMTVNANIVTAVHADVLTVPSSAVKTTATGSTVQVFVPPLSDAAVSAAGAQGVQATTLPQSVPVTVGISDDTSVEILSGLSEGQQIVTRTVNTTTAANTPANGSSRNFGGPGIRL